MAEQEIYEMGKAYYHGEIEKLVRKYINEIFRYDPSDIGDRSGLIKDVTEKIEYSNDINIVEANTIEVLDDAIDSIVHSVIYRNYTEDIPSIVEKVLDKRLNKD